MATKRKAQQAIKDPKVKKKIKKNEDTNSDTKGKNIEQDIKATAKKKLTKKTFNKKQQQNQDQNDKPKKKQNKYKNVKKKEDIQPLQYEFGDGKFSDDQLKIVCWNVNGIRSILTRKDTDNLDNYMKKEDPDIMCINELKIDEESFLLQDIQEQINKKQYFQYYNFCKPPKKGYSGVAIFSKVKPIKIIEDFNDHTEEGRTLTAVFDQFIVLTSYVPHSGFELDKLDYKQKFNSDLQKHINELKKNHKKPVILIGDFNVCHKQQDLQKNLEKVDPQAGFTPQERQDFSNLLEKENLIDTFRHLYPDKIQWSYLSFFKFSKKLFRKRIDYALICDSLLKYLQDSIIQDEYEGSDHVPIQLQLDFSK